MTVVTLVEPEIDTVILTWTGLELHHATTEAGVYTLLAAIPYVADQQTYTYSDVGGLATDYYKMRRYGPGATYGSFSETWTVTTPATTGRRSLQNLRRIMARSLHSLTLATTTTAGNALGTSVIATALANSVSSNRYKHAWVMPTSGAQAGVVRRVRAEDALNLTTGELQIAPAFSAQLATAVEIEIHRLLPPVDDDGWSGLTTCINNALRECWTTDRLAVAGVNGQAAYSLAAWEEWLDPQAVLEFRNQAVASGLNAFPAGSFDSIRDADSLTLGIYPTLSTGDAATVEVFRPTDTWIKVGGVWGASTEGLVNDTDEQLLQPDLVVQVALVHAYEALASGPDGDRYEGLARRQRFKANLMKTSLDHRQRQTHSGLVTGGYGWADKSSPLGIW